MQHKSKNKLFNFIDSQINPEVSQAKYKKLYSKNYCNYCRKKHTYPTS